MEDNIGEPRWHSDKNIPNLTVSGERMIIRDEVHQSEHFRYLWEECKLNSYVRKDCIEIDQPD